MKEAWLIEEMWTDPLENSHELAFGYKPIGIALTEEAANRLVLAGGPHPGSRWPEIKRGTPKRRATKLTVLQ